ncbi:MAG: peptidoglycan editing factor PgeF [Aliidiomarina sp.]|uniref:peptidoglycan editing factor PgeF n=1 Tax=Aliidiomarina sp. TaxID=1872439 RepID=UPI0025C2377A|nr:peptidoglycan editing factor PgeF [Aliidiomarina sp.]MCH8501858.1 peptidoglycan editing factor PgeF [Aliidiomarina sp.]
MMGLTPQLNTITGVRAFSTTRHGGVSAAPFASLNLGSHVGDLPAAVQKNRQRLVQALKLPHEPCWLNQVHENTVVRLMSGACADTPEADASYTNVKGTVLAIQTADCLPILLAADDGSEIAAIHSGWRSLAAGIIRATLEQFSSSPQRIHAWLGPAIGSEHFEVGDDVRSAMLDLNTEHESAFKPYGEKYLADLTAIASQTLRSLGVNTIEASQICTYANAEDYFSFRRDGQTGRMASLIWME